jgi:uncharacterized protein Yka (UPF0111/DUF47 family)
MPSLQKLLGKDDQFFDLLEASAEQARRSAQALRMFLQDPSEQRTLDEFIALRRKDKAITTRIGDALCTNMVTALEPHDIEALANSIYKIPKTVEKAAERMLLAPQHLHGVDLLPQVGMVELATGTLCQMVKELRKGMSKTRVAALNTEMQSVEGQADKHVLELLKSLYSAHEHAGRLLFLKDIYELLERVTDRCRDAGNVISHIVLKCG